MSKEFKPYVPAEKSPPESTATSIILGVLLAIIFGMANAYLGLRVGMTISASIPAAVMSMSVIRILMKRNSILESNMMQTIGSAGESVAAGAIFTLPCLFLWESEGIADAPNMLAIAAIAIAGGLLGVLFMIPLRNALIVKEHDSLPYPEGTACAEVLLAGENGGAAASTVFAGMGFAAAVKLVTDGLKIVPATLEAPIRSLKTAISAEIYPAIIGVGYICGARITSYMFAGGLLAWFVLIPAIVTFGANTVLFPGAKTVGDMYALGGPDAIWSTYIRYIGAGMVAAGGILSLIKTLPMIIGTFVDAVKTMKGGKSDSALRTDKSLGVSMIGIGILVLVIICLLPSVPIRLPDALLIVLFGFFFGTVSSRMVGMIGTSNNPVSGMTIATLLVSTLVLKATGRTGVGGMVAAISIASVICITATIAGDTSQDLKTGFLIGATPKKQQIGELIGVLISALLIGFVMLLLNKAWGFGSAELPAPQASLMKVIVEGVMNGNLPWELVFIGVFIALVIEILGIPVLPVAIGLYLPLDLSAGIMIGGTMRYIVERKGAKDGKENEHSNSGILFCSGLIAGEGLVGILLALLTVLGINKAIDLSLVFDTGMIGGIVLLLITLAVLYYYAKKKSANS